MMYYKLWPERKLHLYFIGDLMNILLNFAKMLFTYAARRCGL